MNTKVLKILAQNKFYKLGIKIQIGRFIPLYWDPKASLSDPLVLKTVAQEFAKIIKKIRPKIKVIAGGATGGISLAAATALELKMPWVYIRDKAKGYSTKKMIEGLFKKGSRAVLLDDVIASGSAKRIFLDNAKNELVIKDILVILDDANGNYPDWVKKKKIKIQPLFTKLNRDNYYKKIGFFGSKILKLEKIYVADKDNWQKQEKNLEIFKEIKKHYYKNSNFKI